MVRPMPWTSHEEVPGYLGTYSLVGRANNFPTTQLRLPEFAWWLVANSCNW